MSIQYSPDEIESICKKHDIKHYSHITDYFKKNPNAPNKDLHLEVLRSRLNDLVKDSK